jgi:hypothetical protein
MTVTLAKEFTLQYSWKKRCSTAASISGVPSL